MLQPMRSRLSGRVATIRILHIIASLSPDRGGPVRSVTGLASAQAACGASITVVAGSDDGTLSSVNQESVRIIRAPLALREFEVPGLRLLSSMADEIHANDIVHIHGVWNGVTTAASLMCRRFRKPYVISPRGMLDAANVRHRRLFKHGYYHIVERPNLMAAAGWHFLDFSEQEGCSWMGIRRQKTHCLVAPNGVAAEKLAARALSQGGFPNAVPRNALRLVFLGRLHPIKGLELQVDLVRALSDRGVEAHLLLIGPDDGMQLLLERRARASGILKKVHFLGPMYGDERVALLREANAVLLSSHYECNSTAAAEAMATGGVLIASDTCHLDIAHAHGAAIVVPRRVADFVAAIEHVTSTPVIESKQREAAKKFAKDHLSWPVIARRFLPFYQSLLREKPICAA